MGSKSICQHCKKEFIGKRNGAKFCSDTCRLNNHRSARDVPKEVVTVKPITEVKSIDESKVIYLYLIDSKGVKKNITKDIVDHIYKANDWAIPEAKVGEPGIKPLAQPLNDKQATLNNLRSIISEVENKPVEVLQPIVKPVVDLKAKEAHYTKRYTDCEFQDEYKALWNEIDSDEDLTPIIKTYWRMRLNAK